MSGSMVLVIFCVAFLGFVYISITLDLVSDLLKLIVWLVVSPVRVYRFFKNGDYKTIGRTSSVPQEYFVSDTQPDALQQRVLTAFQHGYQPGPAIYELEKFEPSLVVIRVRWAPGARSKHEDGSQKPLPPQPWLFGELRLRPGVLRVVETSGQRFNVQGTIGHFTIAYNAIPIGELDTFVEPIVDTFPEVVIASIRQNNTQITFVPASDPRVIQAFQGDTRSRT